MTDEQIIKALEDVRYHLTSHEHKTVINEAIDLINELLENSENTQKAIDFWRDRSFQKQAEAEKLKAEQQNHKDFLLPIMEAREDIKAEAIKEFADKLKDEINQAIYTYYNHAAGGYYLAENCIDEIDNLVKEMGCGE